MTNDPPFEEQLAIERQWRSIGGMNALPVRAPIRSSCMPCSVCESVISSQSSDRPFFSPPKGTFNAADRFTRLSFIVSALPTSNLTYLEMVAGAMSAVRNNSPDSDSVDRSKEAGERCPISEAHEGTDGPTHPTSSTPQT